MKDIASLITEATLPDITQKHEAFGELVRRFQDMVYGYAYAILGDFHLAEDVAQEAFITAYQKLDQLRDAKAFPGWLKRIVLTQCNRMTRRKSLPTEPLETALGVSTVHSDPAEIMLEKEMSDSILMAVQALPEKERMVTTLLYINGYSQNEVANFLEVSVGTVNSRLHRSREKLKERMIAMIQENLHGKRPSRNERFVRKVLEGVPRVGYMKRDDGRYEFTTFASCLKSCMRFLGEDFSYEYIMTTSGAGLRFMWLPHLWDGGNSDILQMAGDTLEPMRRAFKAVGYSHEVIIKAHINPAERRSWAAELIKNSAIGVDGRTADKEGFRQCVVESIDEGRPILAFGVIGPPECCIITGYEDDGETLIGWNFFQEKQDNSESDLPFAIATGVAGFRKSDWFTDTCGLILIGEKQQMPSLAELYRSSLKWALTVLRTTKVGDHYCGIPAYTAWAEDISNDEYFPPDNVSILCQRLDSHYDATMMLSERGHVASFLRQIADHEPNMARDLEKAAKCLEDEGTFVSKMHEATGGHISFSSDEQLRKFAEPVIRQQIADIILQARDKYTEAAHHIEQALAK